MNPLMFLLPLCLPSAPTSDVPPRATVPGALERLPLSFVENRGQWDPAVRFAAQRGQLSVRVEETAFAVQYSGRDDQGAARALVMRLRFEDACEDAAISGLEPQSSRRSYFSGADPSRWHADVPAYSKVVYRELYEGIDLVLREAAGLLEYDLLLAPDADLGRVVISCEGIDSLAVAADGALVIESPLGTITQRPPTTWCVAASGEKLPVECDFVERGAHRYGFRLRRRPAGLPVVIDPGLEWSTFLGGSDFDALYALGTDTAGRVYVGGYSQSPDFPTTPGAYDPAPNGQKDGVVACLDPAQTGAAQLVWASYLGGAADERVMDIVLDEDENVLLTGHTSSADFPTTSGAYDGSSNGGWDAFVARLSSDGASLLYSTFLGGTAGDHGLQLALVSGGGGGGAPSVVLAGTTDSPDYPTGGGAAQGSLGGGTDHLVSMLTLAGGGAADLVYSTFLGGSLEEGFVGNPPGNMKFLDVAVLPGPSSFEIYVTGQTRSPDFWITAGTAYDTTLSGAADSFLTRIDPNAAGPAGITYSTFLGGSGVEGSSVVRVGGPQEGLVTVGGSTDSTDFPTSAGALQPSFAGGLGSDAFLFRLDPDLPPADQLRYSTYLGGEGYDSVRDLRIVDAAHELVVVGATGDSLAQNSFPSTCGAFDPNFNGQGDGYIAYLNPRGNGASDLLYGTFVGGASLDVAYSVEWVAGAPAPTVDVAVGTTSADFPTTPGAVQPTFGGGGADGGALRLELNPHTYCDAEGNSADPDGAIICGTGSVAVADNDLTLSATGLPGNRFGYFLMSASRAFVPNMGGGKGNLCLGAPQIRFAKNVLHSGTTGQMSFQPDLTDLPQGTVVNPGETWYFQLWYRDVDPVQTSNTSNGLAVTFR